MAKFKEAYWKNQDEIKPQLEQVVYDYLDQNFPDLANKEIESGKWPSYSTNFERMFFPGTGRAGYNRAQTVLRLINQVETPKQAILVAVNHSNNGTGGNKLYRMVLDHLREQLVLTPENHGFIAQHYKSTEIQDSCNTIANAINRCLIVEALNAAPNMQVEMKPVQDSGHNVVAVR